MYLEGNHSPEMASVVVVARMLVKTSLSGPITCPEIFSNFDRRKSDVTGLVLVKGENPRRGAAAAVAVLIRRSRIGFLWRKRRRVDRRADFVKVSAG